MANSLLSIGSSGLNAAFTALQTTGNNIANVNTPGYSREITSFSPQIQTDLGSIYIGTGVRVDAISRAYSSFLAQQTNLAQAMASQADQTATLTQQINSMFSDSTTGLGAAIDNFFTQIQALSASPGSASTRQATLSAAQEMAGQFNAAAAQLQSMNQSATQQLSQEISTVNTTVGQIASLNDQIALASASGNSPNSLLDQRDQDILTLNQAVGVTTSAQTDGKVNIYLANGQPLLVGDTTFAMTMGADPQNPQNVIVGTSVGGIIAPLDPNNSGGGAIGALLQFQQQTIPTVENQLGRLAVTLSSQFNALQAQGVDQNGNPGTAFFSTPSIAVVAASTNPDVGTVSVNASYSDVTKLQASNYQLRVQGGNYTLTRLSDGATVASGTVASLQAAPLVVDGMSLSLSNAPASGDVFTIEPVQLGANNLSVALSQGSQIAAASPMQATAASTNAGTLAVGNLALQPLPQNIDSNPANPNAQLQDSVTFHFTSPTSYTYTDTTTGYTSGPQSYTAGQPININGWSLTLTGTPANGDSVTVAPNASAVGSGDNRNALLMTQLQGQPIVDGVTLDGAYSAAVANVGAIASTAQTDQTSKDAILQNATAAQSSVSGVNLDEEASKLMQYQQQYQAAAQLIQVSDSVFNTLITVIDAVPA
ncbi:MAG TPA: flagellar hook-associated protein FlgK [Burkholderiaceae bacterium]|nr:flagellar hook-associated protein FlgK [Burkholderiaceae bacterium]